jgi:cytoskeleton protein RodZ
MPSDQAMPLKQWGEALAKARHANGQSVDECARELRISTAQVRGIESASLSAFHGEGYYRRAVQKYATHLGVELDPPISNLPLTDSQIALKRFDRNAVASRLATRETLLTGAQTVPSTGSRKTHIGRWLIVILAGLVGLGTYLAVGEGWPTKHDNNAEPVSVTTEQVTITTSPQKSTDQTSRTDVDVLSDSTTKTDTSSDALSPPPVGLTIQETTAQTTVNINAQIAEPAVVIETETKTETEAKTATVPAPKPEPVPTIATPATDTLQITFDGDCWVEVRFKDGRLEQKVYVSGEKLTLAVADIERLVFGNAQAARATRGEQAFDLLRFARGGSVARISEADLQQP